MKKKYIVILLIVMFGLGIGVDKLLLTNNDVDDGVSEPSRVEHKNMLSMMLEQNAGEGDYSLETRSSWPTKEDGYVFNSSLSKCEKGSKLRWDDENNAVVMVGTTSDKCYVYFDVYVEPYVTLANWVKDQYDGIQGNNNLYYHDSTLENGAGDNSYRYAGSSDKTNNFVCFGSDAETCPNDNLYRIIGVFDGRVRLIKADYATSTLLGTDTSDYVGTGTSSESNYQGDSSNLKNIAKYHWNKANYDASYTATGYYNDWSYSELNKTHLNKYFLANIGSTWASMIDSTVWKVGGNTDQTLEYLNANTAYINEITSPSTQVASTYESKVGLMYVSDYYYGASPTYWTYPGYRYSSSGVSYDYRVAIGENWMYMGLYEWTMSRTTAYSSGANFVFYSGYVSEDDVNILSWAVRPVFHLESSINYVSGSGTKEDSIRIN